MRKFEPTRYSDHGLKSAKLTGQGEDIGRQAGTSCIVNLKYELTHFCKHADMTLA